MLEHAPYRIEGRIVFTSNIPAFNNASIHIYVEDISYADAEAIVLAEKIIQDVQHSSATIDKHRETIIYFNLPLGREVKINESNDYAVRVWVDMNRGGQNSSQDLYSDQSIRVLTQGYGNKIEIVFTY